MPNLYITNSTTTTTVGLTNQRKTTPSLVVTCGNTTYYGGLTTCAAWATSPNKMVVTSGSTTYYTMAPAKGTKFVNFVVPTQCSQVSGTILTKCCAGYLGTCDKAASNIVMCYCGSSASYGYGNTTTSLNNCYKLLSYVTSDTTQNCYDFVYPALNHTHSTSIVFDDNTWICDVKFCSRHKGVKIYCNYNTAPNYIYAFCNSTTGIANSGWDYLYVNGTDQCQSTTHICAYLYKTSSASTGVWNTSGVTSTSANNNTHITYSHYASGPNSAALYRTPNSTYGTLSMTHTQYITEDRLVVVYKGCEPGFALPIFEVNMACYDHDIDKLPAGTILMTNCPLSCFDTNCWETPSYLSNLCCPNIFTNKKRGTIKPIPYVDFCVSPSYTGAYNSYDSAGTFSNFGMWPWSCSGSVGNCTYKPIMSTWHNHSSCSNSGVMLSFAFPSGCLPMVKGGSCYIVHK